MGDEETDPGREEKLKAAKEKVSTNGSNGVVVVMLKEYRDSAI